MIVEEFHSVSAAPIFPPIAVFPPIEAPTSRYLARQPILDHRREVVGYELLFRAGWENYFSGERETAALQTLDNYVYMGIESLTGKRLAFVNCTRETLVDKLVTVLPPQTTVLEILETVEPDEELVKACTELRAMGYMFALDDFLPRPEMRPLVALASYIKVDFQACDAPIRKQIREMMRGGKAALVAENIRDQKDFNTAKAEGYKYFQGYFFCRPTILANREIPANRMNYLKLLIELNRKHLDLREVVRLVQLEVSLYYRLLLLANSARWSRRTDVTSVQDAFLLVGENRFRSLVSVAASCVLGQNQSSALISLSLERARFCELLAPKVGQNPSEQFMVGLLSLLDAMLESPMEGVVQSLPLRAEAKAALLGEAGATGATLGLIKGFELGAWGSCEAMAGKLGLSEETVSRAYVDSMRWAMDAIASNG
jgi:c-di-GMP-related signal transduction protein